MFSDPSSVFSDPGSHSNSPFGLATKSRNLCVFVPDTCCSDKHIFHVKAAIPRDVTSHNLLITQRCLLHLLSCVCGHQVASKHLQHLPPPPTILPVPKSHVFNILLSCNHLHTSFGIDCTKIQSQNVPAYSLVVLKLSSSAFRKHPPSPPPNPTPIFSHLSYPKGSYRGQIYSWNDYKKQQFKMRNISLSQCKDLMAALQGPGSDDSEVGLGHT